MRAAKALILRNTFQIGLDLNQANQANETK